VSTEVYRYQLYQWEDQAITVGHVITVKFTSMVYVRLSEANYQVSWKLL